MNIRLLFATPDPASLALLQSLISRAMALTCFPVSTSSVETYDDLMDQVEKHTVDVILLDWPMAESDTPDLVREILTRNSQMRVVALLPLGYREYRRSVWDAGACNSIPKEHMDQEWLSSILCVMHRAMEREARILAGLGNAPTVPTACGARLMTEEAAAN